MFASHNKKVDNFPARNFLYPAKKVKKHKERSLSASEALLDNMYYLYVRVGARHT